MTVFRLARNWFRWIASLTMLLIASVAVGSPSPNSDICVAAAHFAARQTGVPVNILNALALTETGRRHGDDFSSWPWTVNMEGKGDWFPTRQLALDYATKHHARGARSFDVGCFQLNFRWHGHAFSSIAEMFDPEANALYAARFLVDLYREKGNWPEAVGAYHSRTPEFSNRYRKRFERILANLSPEQLAPVTEPPNIIAAQPSVNASNKPAPAANNFPLLQSGSTAMASLGSLMPESAGVGARSLLGGG